MTGNVFADTNLLVYGVDDRDPVKRERSLSLQAEVPLVVSAQVLNEFYHVVTRRLPRPLGAEVAGQMLELYLRWPVVAVDAALLRRALEAQARWRLSWWDTLVVAAANSAGCTTLYTEDLQDGARYDAVTVQNPFRAGSPR